MSCCQKPVKLNGKSRNKDCDDYLTEDGYILLTEALDNYSVECERVITKLADIAPVRQEYAFDVPFQKEKTTIRQKLSRY